MIAMLSALPLTIVAGCVQGKDLRSRIDSRNKQGQRIFAWANRCALLSPLLPLLPLPPPLPPPLPVLLLAATAAAHCAPSTYATRLWPGRIINYLLTKPALAKWAAFGWTLSLWGNAWVSAYAMHICSPR